MVYICGVFFVWISTLVTQSEQGVLPHPKKVNIHRIRNINEAPIKTNNYEHELTQHENTVIRKSLSGLRRHFGKLRSVLPRSEFDENGMIYLSHPKYDDDRKINALMNKVVKYKTEDEKYDLLRSRLKDLFNSEEIERLQGIAEELRGDYRQTYSNENDNTKLRTVYEFSDLVV